MSQLLPSWRAGGFPSTEPPGPPKQVHKSATQTAPDTSQQAVKSYCLVARIDSVVFNQNPDNQTVSYSQHAKMFVETFNKNTCLAFLAGSTNDAADLLRKYLTAILDSYFSESYSRKDFSFYMATSSIGTNGAFSPEFPLTDPSRIEL